MVLNQGNFASQRLFVNIKDIFDCHNWSGTIGILWVEAKDTSKYSVMYRKASPDPKKKIIQPKLVNST